MKPISHPHPSDVTLAMVLHALADPTRLALLLAIIEQGGPVTTPELAPQQATSSVHEHLAVLRQAGLIWTRKGSASLEHSDRTPDHAGRYGAVVEAIVIASRCETPLAGSSARRQAEMLWNHSTR